MEEMEQRLLQNFGRHLALHCVGIGGAGVSVLAELLLDSGCSVSGSDLISDSVKCSKLKDLGAKIAPSGHRAENIPVNCDGLIVTSAATEDNPEIQEAKRRGLSLWKRGEFLALFAKRYRRVCAVAGAHGKSSVTALTAWILAHSQKNPGVMIGAELNDGALNGQAGDGDVFVTEADESDGSFALLSGELALIPNIDDDHAWDEEARIELDRKFLRFAGNFRKVIALPCCEHTQNLYGELQHVEILSAARFSELERLVPETLQGFQRRNAVLALAGAAYLGIDPEQGAQTLATFPGVARRMTEHGVYEENRILLVEDYAHHPAELEASLELLHLRYPERELVVVFQPHRYQRLMRYLERFVRILSSNALRVWLLPVFAAWSEQGSVDSAMLAERIRTAGGHADVLGRAFAFNAMRILKEARQSARPCVIAVIGAGDLNAIIPEMQKILKKTTNLNTEQQEEGESDEQTQ